MSIKQTLSADNTTLTLSIDGVGGLTIKNTGQVQVPAATTSSGALQLQQNITLATAVASTSGTSIDFTGIPSWVKRITFMFDGVSTNGSSLILIQLGDSGGVETTGYSSAASYVGNTNTTGVGSSGAGFMPIFSSGATVLVYGSVVLARLSEASNTWVMGGAPMATTGSAWYVNPTGGSKSLSATLDRVRLTTANGTDTFDAGTVNIAYE